VRILVIGSGAREHAIIHTLLKDKDVFAVFAAPGNAGISKIVRTYPLDIRDATKTLELAIDLKVDLVVIGPEIPLAEGVADVVRNHGIPVFGPNKDAAQIESSKSFAKDVMKSAGVPTARWFDCKTREEVEEALTSFSSPYVVKDDSLAQGKGVIVTDSIEEARAHAYSCLEHGKVVIEEFLSGEEVSLFLLSDGNQTVPLQPAQDFKRVFDNDEGPNTGGMGAYSPLPFLDKNFGEVVSRDIGDKVIAELRNRGMPFVGLLYAGLIITSDGVKVIEFNARFGDPETQVVLSRLLSPLGDVLIKTARGELESLPPLQWSDDSVVNVVLASEKYPDTPTLGDEIVGLEEAQSVDGVEIFHAGTIEKDGQIVSAGGRVLSVTASGYNLTEARKRAYEAIDKISLRGGQYRSDIAKKASENQG
jgi:phosphoribosylamine---glycine ligase